MADIRPETQIKQIKEMLDTYRGALKDESPIYADEETKKEFYESIFDADTTLKDAYEMGYAAALGDVIDNIEMMMEKEWE